LWDADFRFARWLSHNVWEWTADPFTPDHSELLHPCCAPENGRHPPAAARHQGASHLCAPNYCLRYRPAARQGETVDTTTGHIGFRCVVS
jgi:formylglycine-generating enzyme